MKAPWGIVLALAAMLSACEEAPPVTPATDGVRAVTVAVGADVREVPFSEVQCRETGEIQVVELLSSGTVPEGHPRVLIVRLQGDKVLEAHAFMPQVSFEGVDYDMLHLIAKSVPGAKKPDCRVEPGVQTTVICNDTTVVGWLGAGPRPNPSFKVSFSCG